MKALLGKVMDRVVFSPTDVRDEEEGEGKGDEEMGQQIRGVIEREEFRALVAELDGAFEPSFRAGQLNTLMGKMSGLADGEVLSLICPVGYRGGKTVLQIHGRGERGVLVIQVEGGGSPMALVVEKFEHYRKPMIAAAEFREVRVGTHEYDGLKDLRFRELRAPLGLRWSVADLQWEQLERHFGVFMLDHPVATVVVRKKQDGGVRLRQVAVCRVMRGKGYGRMVMEAVEAQLVREGVRDFELHSREEVAGFYEALGYEQVGSIFTEIGIPHVLMRKVV
ncbi:MAG: GNAT family N-acetyltransferase [Verrucomicrobiaceae bacterium]